MRHAFVLAAVLVVAIAATAPAAPIIIDFDDHAGTATADGPAPPESIVDTDYAHLGVIFGRPGVSAGVAVINNTAAFSDPHAATGLDDAGVIDSLTGDIHFYFVTPGTMQPATVDEVRWVMGDNGGDLDKWVVTAYDLNDNQLQPLLLVQSFDQIPVHLTFPGMHRIHVRWNVDSKAGFLFDDLQFEPPPALATPEPASVAFWSLGLVALATARRRKLIAQELASA